MTVDELLSRLDVVKRAARGWQARCPAHDDRTPSLSIREGDRGLLVRCFAGCSFDEICAALRVKGRELFYDQEHDPRAWQEMSRQRKCDRYFRERTQRRRGLEADLVREAEQLVHRAQGINVSNWSDAMLDRTLNLLADAYDVLNREATLYERS